MNIRKLNFDEKDALEMFLKEYADTSMFLRSNLHNSGISYQDKPFYGEYFASFDSLSKINGVLAHYWNGNLMMQSPDLNILRSILDFFKSRVTREIAGILGDELQANTVINELGVIAAEYDINYPDDLYAIELDNLISPININNPDYEMILAKNADRDLLFEWLSAYHVEALGAEVGHNIFLERINREVNSTMEGIDRFILKVKGKPVCLCGFNARLPEIVQIGPVWTPMSERNKGYARTLVALSLIDAQKTSVKRAVLFTNNPPAIRSYESLGFKKTGVYRLAILKKPLLI